MESCLGKVFKSQVAKTSHREMQMGILGSSISGAVTGAAALLAAALYDTKRTEQNIHPHSKIPICLKPTA